MKRYAIWSKKTRRRHHGEHNPQIVAALVRSMMAKHRKRSKHKRRR